MGKRPEMVLTAMSVLADGRGTDPSGVGGVLILIGVIVLVAGTLAAGAWFVIRRSGRPDARGGPDESPQPPRRTGRVRGSG